MIEEAKINQIQEISQCLNNSKLKDNYFNDPDIVKDFLKESINKRELYIYKK